MSEDAIRGKMIRWTFTDGPMANKTFEHTFDKGGTVTWRMLDEKGQGKPSKEKETEKDKETKYEAVIVGQNVQAISYLGSSGYTLTVILDFQTNKLVAFASNEKDLTVQRGTFETSDNVHTGTRKRELGKASHPH